jgi:bifunctional DNA-binding transcriptional regulator/antitoxin component of YhaV-PrlF toxin-antitoxin module
MPVATRHNVLRATVDRDGRNRACVPNNLTKSVGIKPLDFVYVAKRAHGSGLVILRKVAKTGHLSTYRVDKDGNIRLSDSLLSKGNLGSSSSIKFRTSNTGDSIIVVAG